MEQRYQTIARRLMGEIVSGAIAKDKSLPTRAELAERFGVARATIDRAVTSLVRKGVLEARRGSGTVVSAADAPRRTVALLRGGGGIPPEVDAPPGLKVEQLFYDSLTTRSARLELRRFDGLLWSFPEDREVAWARETPSDLPQLIINRHLEDFNYVSTDHRGAIRGITERRLAACPKGMPVFLSLASSGGGLVLGMREEGFIDACRKAGRFYEFLPLPDDFHGKTAALDKKFTSPLKRPLILVSGCLGITGAVVAWAAARGLAWGKNLFYSDFDNDYPISVWGLTVTSFLQDYETLTTTAMAKLLDLITGAAGEVKLLIPPKFVEGGT